MMMLLPILSLLFFFNVELIFSQNITNLYPSPWKSDCHFPFTYRGKAYTDCTTDGDNGNIPWCSLTPDYKGLITYCFDFRNTTIQCLPSFTMPNGRTFTSCAFLSATARYRQCQTNNPAVKYRFCTDAMSSPEKPPLDRHSECDPAYASLAQDHTMCYGPSKYANVVPFTEDERQELLDVHNEYRAAVPSKYMFKLYWDDELAKLAQAHANLCAFEHDSAANRRSPKFNWLNGQNIVMSSEIRTTPASLFGLMFSEEKENFRYGSTCAPFENTCLHYTQLMISNLTRMGCAQTHCVYPHGIERFLTCNYILSQYEDNYQTPYIPSDTPASDCPSKAIDGLCDCGNQTCAYDKGEYLEPDTCNCRTSPGKRSIDKRDYRGDEFGLPAGKYETTSIEKRGLTRIPLPKPGKRSIQKRDANDDELEQHSQHYMGITKGQIATPNKGRGKRGLHRIDLKQHKISQK